MHIPHPSFKSHLLHLTRTARAMRKKRRRRKLPQSPSSWANSGLAPRNSSYLARRFLGCVGTGDGHPVMAVSFSTGPTLQCREPIAAKKHGTRPFGDGLYNPVISISGDFGAGCPNEWPQNNAQMREPAGFGGNIINILETLFYLFEDPIYKYI